MKKSDVIMSARQMNVHYIYITYVRDRSGYVFINDSATTTSSLVAVNTQPYFISGNIAIYRLIFPKERNPQRITIAAHKEFLN